MDKEATIPRNDMRQAMHGMKPSCPEGKAMGAVPYTCRQDKLSCKCHKQGKRIVLYLPSDGDFIVAGSSAYIRCYDDKGYTCTTSVLSYDMTTDVFETEHAIYKPAKYENI